MLKLLAYDVTVGTYDEKAFTSHATIFREFAGRRTVHARQ